MIRRSHTLAANFEVISKEDDALDKELPDFEERWARYQDGAGEPPLKPGGKPATFILKHLRAVERNRMQRYSGEPLQLAFAACALALVSVEGLVDEDMKPLKIRHELDSDLHAVSVVSPESMNLLGEGLCIELGAVALRRSALRPN